MNSIPLHTNQPQVIAKDSADGVLGDIAAAGATAAHNIANFLLDGIGITRAGADMQGLGFLGSGDGPIHVVERTSLPVSIGRPAYAGGASKQSRRLPKEDADKIKEESGHIADPRTKQRAKVAKRTVSEAAATLGIGKSSNACASPTTSSTAVATTWTSAPDETLAKSIMSRSMPALCLLPLI